MKKLAVLVSGAGTTLANLCDHIAQGDVRARVELVISNNRKAERVIKDAGLAFSWYFYTDAVPNMVFQTCDRAGIDLIVMAGWNKLLTIPEKYRGKVLNIHPTLLPKYGGKGMYGLKPHEAVLAAGETESGCTVHIADNEYDHGTILEQEKVPVLPGDTALILQQRVQEAERRLYPKVIQGYLDAECGD